MAEQNTPIPSDLNKSFEETDFKNIIGGPLLACVKAQKEAALTSYDYLKQMGFERDDSQLGDYKPIHMVFYFIRDDGTYRLSIPLVSILPAPYLNIGHVDLRYQATVTALDENTFKAKYAPAEASITLSGEEQATAQFKAREAIDIHIHASTVSLPSGMAKLMEILDTQMTDMLDYIEDEQGPKEQSTQ